MGLRVWGLGFEVRGLWFRFLVAVEGFGFEVWGLGVGVWCLGRSPQAFSSCV